MTVGLRPAKLRPPGICGGTRQGNQQGGEKRGTSGSDHGGCNGRPESSRKHAIAETGGRKTIFNGNRAPLMQAPADESTSGFQSPAPRARPSIQAHPAGMPAGRDSAGVELEYRPGGWNRRGMVGMKRLSAGLARWRWFRLWPGLQHDVILEAWGWSPGRVAGIDGVWSWKKRLSAVFARRRWFRLWPGLVRLHGQT